jgi:hypothetical protein
LAAEIAVASSTARASDFQIDWRGLAPDAAIVPAQKFTLPVKVTKPAGSTGTVRLTLLTSQSRPLANGQLDPNQALRLEKPIELAANVSDGDAVMLVPPQPLSPVYDVTVQAELLAPDKKPIAVAFAPVRRLTVRHQVVVKLDGPPRIEVQSDPKMAVTVKIQGQVERREGMVGDVTLTLTGLPPGPTTAPVVVKAGTTAFTVNVVLPANAPAGEIGDLKLFGTGPADAKQPNIVVRSRDVDVTLVVRPPPK